MPTNPPHQGGASGTTVQPVEPPHVDEVIQESVASGKPTVTIVADSEGNIKDVLIEEEIEEQEEMQQEEESEDKPQEQVKKSRKKASLSKKRK